MKIQNRLSQTFSGLHQALLRENERLHLFLFNYRSRPLPPSLPVEPASKRHAASQTHSTLKSKEAHWLKIKNVQKKGKPCFRGLEQTRSSLGLVTPMQTEGSRVQGKQEGRKSGKARRICRRCRRKLQTTFL